MISARARSGTDAGGPRAAAFAPAAAYPALAVILVGLALVIRGERR